MSWYKLICQPLKLKTGTYYRQEKFSVDLLLPTSRNSNTLLTKRSFILLQTLSSTIEFSKEHHLTRVFSSDRYLVFLLNNSKVSLSITQSWIRCLEILHSFAVLDLFPPSSLYFNRIWSLVVMLYYFLPHPEQLQYPPNWSRDTTAIHALAPTPTLNLKGSGGFTPKPGD